MLPNFLKIISLLISQNMKATCDVFTTVAFDIHRYQSPFQETVSVVRCVEVWGIWGSNVWAEFDTNMDI